MSPHAAQFVAIMGQHRGKENAIKGAELARLMSLPDAREVRNVLAREHEAIISLFGMRGDVLMALFPHGYWLTTESAQIPEHFARLNARIVAATRARDRFAANVRAAGLGGVLQAKTA